MINYTIQFLDEQTQEPVIGLPVTRKFCWANNKLGFGSGCQTNTYKTDGNGNINFQLPDINIIEASGASSLVITTPKITPTEYQTGYMSTSNSYTVGSWQNNTSVGKTVLVPEIAYSSVTSSSTITQNTSYTNTTVSGTISNITSSLSKYTLWIIIGIILIVGLIFVVKLKGNSSNSLPIGV